MAKKASVREVVPTSASTKSDTGPLSISKSKPKLVRDSFTIPKDEYALLMALKERSVALARPAKKGELLRAGIAALGAMSDKRLLAALDAVPSLKTGRPPATGAARQPLTD